MVRKKKTTLKKSKTKRTVAITSVRPANVADANIFYVLDEDPIRAARSLVIKQVAPHARRIAESLTFKYLTDNDILSEATLMRYYRFKPDSFIFRTPYNIIFFSSMYEELAKIYFEYSGTQLTKVHRFNEEDMLYNTSIATFPKNRKEELSLPDYLSSIKKKKAFSKYNVLGTDHATNSDIELHRLMYMIDGYLLSDFPCGAPAWYSPLAREIYRKYDRLAKKTFIIQTDTEGKYRYFFEYSSGAVIEITKLEDMRELIDSFLFKV